MVLGVAPLSISSLMGWDATLPGLEAAKSFLAMMDDRSPGDRTAAELTKTKQKSLADSQPKQRALGKVVTPPPEFEAAIAPPPPEIAELPPFAAAITNLGPLMVIPPPPTPGGGFTTTADTPPGGGGTPPPGGETPPENPPPPVVPEPGTWATMLLGFGLTGWLLRRRRRTSAVTYSA